MMIHLSFKSKLATVAIIFLFTNSGSNKARIIVSFLVDQKKKEAPLRVLDPHFIMGQNNEEGSES